MSLKKFKESIILYSSGTIVSRLSSFLLVPLYTHILSVEEYGLLSTLLISSQLLITIIDFGVMPSIIRMTPEIITSNKEGKFLGTVLTINIISGLILSIIILFFFQSLIISSFNTNISFSTLILFCLMSFTQAVGLNLITYFRASEQNKKFTFYSIISTFTLLLLNIIALYFFKLGINGILLANTISYLIFAVMISFKLNTQYSLSFDLLIAFRTLKYGVPLIFTRSSDLVVATTGVYFLGMYTDFKSVGLYSLALKYCAVLQVLFLLPFQLTFEPYLFNNLKDENLIENLRKIINFFILIFLLLATALIIVTRDFITVIAPKEYSDSYILIIYILPIYAIQGLQHIFQSFIHIKKKTYITGILSVIISIISLILNYLLIKEFGIGGILSVKYFNEVFFLILLSYFSYKFFNNLKINLSTILLSFLSYVVFSFILVKIIHFSTFKYYLISSFIMTIILAYFFITKQISYNQLKNLLKVKENT